MTHGLIRIRPTHALEFRINLKMETPPRRRKRTLVATPKKLRFLRYCRLCSCRYPDRLHSAHIFSFHHVRNVQRRITRFYFVSCMFRFLRIISNVTLENPNEIKWKPRNHNQSEIATKEASNKSLGAINKRTYEKSNRTIAKPVTLQNRNMPCEILEALPSHF